MAGVGISLNLSTLGREGLAKPGGWAVIVFTLWAAIFSGA